eukprot:m.140717 g.140717  ORF g.140717 m.140717 type:complete len:67 (+) comp11534_c0_seq3:1774-1974(+)
MVACTRGCDASTKMWWLELYMVTTKGMSCMCLAECVVLEAMMMEHMVNNIQIACSFPSVDKNQNHS